MSSSSQSPPTIKKRPKTATSQERAIPFNVSMPAPDSDRLQTEAEKEGVSRSELIRRALQVYYYKQDN